MMSFATFAYALLLMPLAIFHNIIKPFWCRSVKGKSEQLPLPPGPTPWPVVGCALDVLRNKPTGRWILRWMEEMDTDVACFRIGNTHIIPTTNPKIAREFLRKQGATFASRPISMAARAFSGGCMTTVISPYGEQWKKMRRVLTSEIICPARHKWLHDKRAEEADNLVKHVFNQCKSLGQVNLRHTTRHYCGNVVRRLGFNKRYFGKGRLDGVPAIHEEQHVDALFNALNYLYAFCVSDYFPFLVGLDLDGHEKVVKDCTRTFRRLHEPIINERIIQWRDESSSESNGKEPQDMLDVLIMLKDSQGKPLLTPHEVKAQATARNSFFLHVYNKSSLKEIMMAAVDNPSHAVEWAMAEMINRPELLQKAKEEIDRVVGKERLVQESDIPQLNYIEACAREAFRLHPIAPFNVPHVAMSHAVVAGYHIPKGSHIVVSRMGLGRNPKVWDEPLKFKPERHIRSDTVEVLLTEPDLRFISFSTGRRGCIAAQLGTTMTVMLLARLIQGFNWSTPPNVSSINLIESRNDLSLAEPLVVQAGPCLPNHLYPM